ncbi:MAG: hypothetical protein OXH57_01220 [Ekhidna sp.]|nr:hypothetical protein [Ekhidna sp.]
MAARLYIFAIGGTGCRVLKSLTMLLAAGVKPDSDKNFEIVPIIIDPHKSNEDLKRTHRLLGNYQAISKKAGLNNGFFSTKITTLNRLSDSENKQSDSFTFNLQEVGGKKFSEYIGYNQLDEANQALADVLFSGTSINKRHEEVSLLDVEMDIGFVGNPNIGSIVLNQVKDSPQFRDFASNFNADDRVFIISSVFGGTGAAGFPTILKNIRGAMDNKKIDSKGFLQDAKIGAVTVLPYFNIEKDDNSPIQKSNFIAKTKAALYYYKDNVTGNNSINVFYYIADNHSGKPYPNDPGDNGQKNKAHFVEMASALAIVDFLETSDSDLDTEAGKAINPFYKEFGIKEDSMDINFSHLEDDTERKIALRLSQFVLFRKYLAEHLSDAVEKEAWSIDIPKIDKNFIRNNSFYRTNLTEFLTSFAEWLIEMSDNKRGFSPFNLDSDVAALIKGRTVKSGWFSSKVDYRTMDKKLSRLAKGKNYTNESQKLIKLFYDATEDILTSKFGFEKLR